jgi:hypothetical protein
MPEKIHFRGQRGSWDADATQAGVSHRYPVMHARNVDWKTKRYTEPSIDSVPSPRWLAHIEKVRAAGRVILINGDYRTGIPVRTGYAGLFEVANVVFVDNVLSFDIVDRVGAIA